MRVAPFLIQLKQNSAISWPDRDVLLFSVHCQPTGDWCIENTSSRVSEDQDVPKMEISSNVGRGFPDAAQRLVLHNYTHMGNGSTLPARKIIESCRML